ncbi:MAG: Rieske (2Fe-2S) protein [Runella slithyformis]|nr:MAG: Rieske (2Fe-2S) protein [Runella slithyformis]TAF00432.1 MAG: Rieske (2Fe-2S) protein [Runella slithyformis]TAF25269.1 MAG: Rieske (2Fe-2S) protein [Runella slithyformis]TAF44428.1 MAG: Rieske (2Fe-2S) protein [Runella slithyformis]TAF80134.1 MAG: Rieske (2Fe-2S) protein [Runella slithyformis]
MEQKETISRGQFIRDLGLSSATLMAFYCMGTTLTSCTNSTPDPTPPPTNPVNTGLTGNAELGKGAINFTLDLTSENFKKLKTEGQFVIVGDVIVANAKGNKLIALAKACTHQGTAVEYRLGNDDFLCANHGSVFNTNGSVKQAPAATPLTVFKTELSMNGNSLVVKV